MNDLDTRKFRTRNLMLLEDKRDNDEDLKNRGYVDPFPVATKWEPFGSLDMSTLEIVTTTVMTGSEILKHFNSSENSDASEQVLLEKIQGLISNARVGYVVRWRVDIFTDQYFEIERVS